MVVEQSRISEHHGGIKSIKTIDENINENSVQIKVQVSFKLIKSNGSWTVNMFKS